MRFRLAALLIIPFLLLNIPAFSKTEAQDVSFQGDRFQYLTNGDCPLPAFELKIIRNKIKEHVSEAYFYQHFDLEMVNARDSVAGCGYKYWHWLLVEAHYKYNIDGYSFPYKVSLEWDEQEDKWDFTDFNEPREVTSVISPADIDLKIRECLGVRYEQFEYSIEPVIRMGFTLLLQGQGDIHAYNGNRTYYFSLNAENGIMEVCTGGPYMAIADSAIPIALPAMGCYGPDCLFSTNILFDVAYIDLQKKSLFFELPKFYDNNTALTVQISRRLIDAKNNVDDGTFSVMLDGDPYPYKEIEKTETHRTLMISSIPVTSKRLDIIGTQVVQTENISPSIAFDRPWYNVDGRGILTIIDRSVNLRNDWTMSNIDTVEARFWSSIDKGGLLVVLRETAPDSGVFQEIATWCDNFDCGGTRLRVEDGGTITLQYGYLTTTARIISTNWLLNFAGPYISGEDTSIQNIPLDDDIKIDGLVTSNAKTPVDFLYILQIKDSDGFTLEIFTKEVSIGGVKPESTISIPWKPNSTGTCEVAAFLWSDLDKPKVLAEFRPSYITVVDST